MAFAESLAPLSRIGVVSCRSDLFPLYKKRGYTEVRRYPLEQDIPEKYMTRTGLEMVIMTKEREKKL